MKLIDAVILLYTNLPKVVVFSTKDNSPTMGSIHFGFGPYKFTLYLDQGRAVILELTKGADGTLRVASNPMTRLVTDRFLGKVRADDGTMHYAEDLAEYEAVCKAKALAQIAAKAKLQEAADIAVSAKSYAEAFAWSDAKAMQHITPVTAHVIRMGDSVEGVVLGTFKEASLVRDRLKDYHAKNFCLDADRAATLNWNIRTVSVVAP